MVCLGLAPHLTAAVATRFIGGLFSSGNAVAVKAMIGRSGSAASQAPLMGWMVAGWGLGTIMGPVIGGALALPCQGWIEGGTLCEEGALLQARWGTSCGVASGQGLGGAAAGPWRPAG
jgi:hypothetical protein